MLKPDLNGEESMGVEKWTPATHLCCGLKRNRYGPSKTTLGNDCGQMWYMYQGTSGSLQVLLLFHYYPCLSCLISCLMTTTTMYWEPTMCKAGADL